MPSIGLGAATASRRLAIILATAAALPALAATIAARGGVA
jgi:hypothetical protein